MSLIELLILCLVVGVVAAIALPMLRNARMSGNEAAAIGSLRAVLSAQADYHAMNNGYADSLATLARRCTGMSVPWLSADLGVNGIEKTGYRFILAPGLNSVEGDPDCNGIPVQTAFYVTARPVLRGETGHRAFAANNAAAIWQNATGNPPVEPFVMNAQQSPLGR